MSSRVAHTGVILGLAVWLITAGCQGTGGSSAESSFSPSGGGDQDSGAPVLVFDTLAHDFGTILEGEQVVCYFDYTNTGQGRLVIQRIESSCGCTTPDWSREPLAPGEGERLQIVFDATGRSGAQFKQVTVVSNAANQKVQLTIRAHVQKNV